MNQLQTSFISNKNANLIINSVISFFSDKYKIALKNDEQFFKIFDTIASTVFKYESKNNISLEQLNTIVIGELINHWKKKLNVHIPEIPPKDYPHHINGDSLPQLPPTMLQTQLQAQQLLPQIVQPGLQPPTAQIVHPAQQIAQSMHPALPSQLQSVSQHQLREQYPLREQYNPQQAKLVYQEGSNEEMYLEPEIISTKINIDTEFKEIKFDNVIFIRVVALSMCNVDYSITENNNTFIFKEWISDKKELLSEDITIVIEPGNYTKEELIEELENEINESSVTKTMYRCYLDPVTLRCIITTNVDTEGIESKRGKGFINCIKNNKKINNKFDISSNSTLLRTLGFTGKNTMTNSDKYISINPVKIVKKPVLDLSIHLNTFSARNDSDSEVITLSEPVILNKEGVVYFEGNSFEKKFIKPINIENFKIDFNGYNRRGYDFNIIVEIRTVFTI
jgi:hypothetical protein